MNMEEYKEMSRKNTGILRKFKTGILLFLLKRCFSEYSVSYHNKYTPYVGVEPMKNDGVIMSCVFEGFDIPFEYAT